PPAALAKERVQKAPPARGESPGILPPRRIAPAAAAPAPARSIDPAVPRERRLRRTMPRERSPGCRSRAGEQEFRIESPSERTHGGYAPPSWPWEQSAESPVGIENAPAPDAICRKPEDPRSGGSSSQYTR